MIEYSSNSSDEATITLIPQAEKIYHQKRKLQGNINDEHRHKILNQTVANQVQQDIKRTTQHDQVGFIQVMQEFINIPKSIDLNRCRESFRKTPISICDNSPESGHRGTLSEHKKGHI